MRTKRLQGLMPSPATRIASVKLRQSQLDQVGREVVASLRIAPPEDTGANVLAELQLERRRVPAVGTT